MPFRTMKWCSEKVSMSSSNPRARPARRPILFQKRIHLLVTRAPHRRQLFRAPRVHRRRPHEAHVHAQRSMDAAAVQAEEYPVVHARPVWVVRRAIRTRAVFSRAHERVQRLSRLGVHLFRAFSPRSRSRTSRARVCGRDDCSSHRDNTSSN